MLAELHQPHATPVGDDPIISEAVAPAAAAGPEESTETKKLGRKTSKSRNGCLNCKIRRKKCDCSRPVCKDCLRFNKNCVWADYKTMTLDEVRQLKQQVREQESTRKMRKRKSRPDSEAEGDKRAKPSFVPNEESQSYISALRTAYLSDDAPPAPVAAPMAAPMAAPLDKTIPVVSTDSLAAFTVPISLPDLRKTPLPQFHEHLHSLSPPPLDLEYHSASPIPGSPAAFLSFLKELSTHNKSDKLTLLDEESDDEPLLEKHLNPSMIDLKSLNIPEFLEHFHNKGSDFNTLANFFGAMSPSPSPALSTLPDLDTQGQYLYNYYVDTLSKKVCIAPNSQNESNSYQKVFLPAAQRDPGVLYGILAWAGFHLGGKWLHEGSKYAEMAVRHLTHGVDFNGNSTIENDRKTIVYKLATILILCGAEICRGDVRYWSVYLNWGWKLLRDNGGILNFDTNKEEHWLISNFAYHDLLGSSTADRGTYFPVSIYETIFADPQGISKGNLNPLLGVCKTLFKVIGEINDLSCASKKSLHDYYNRTPLPKEVRIPEKNGLDTLPEGVEMEQPDEESEISKHGETSRILYSIIDRAKEIEQVIDSSKPDSDDLWNLSDVELELQLTAFEAFQLSCKLYLRQSIMKCNPSSLESQVLVNDLVKCVDILIDTPMQATLVFPIFMSGLHMVTECDRESMRAMLNKMIRVYGPWNVVRVKYLLEKVWEANPDGDRVVDWNSILNELGWELNFA